MGELTNPFKTEGTTSLQVPPCVVVIFGATGDLTHRKLVPAIYNLGVDGLLPANFSLVCFARRKYESAAFSEELKKSVAEHSRRKPLDERVWQEFGGHTHYVTSAFDDDAGYAKLRELLDQIDSKSGMLCNRVYYFATSPDYFETIAHHLGKAGLLQEKHEGMKVVRSARMIIEKPFGHDLDSAKRLNRSLLNVASENQIYRIDHYLGKETVQNLLVFRFANGIFEPIWNHKYIDHVQISVCETLGVGGRAGYFDSAGIIRDIVQNHALQLLCLVASEPPVAFDADSVRGEKVKVLKSVRRYTEQEVSRYWVRGRYQSGSIGGEAVNGYLGETGVNPDSVTDTYAACELFIDNWRWAGVPFYLRSGKRLAKRVTDITIQFKQVPFLLFKDQDVKELPPNTLSFQIQPDEGITFRMNSKPPGPRVRVQNVNMDFSYGTSFGTSAPEAYERLLLDGMRGDATLFTRDDEIEQAWDILDPVLKAWRSGSATAPAVHGYDAGSWGPQAADEMIKSTVKNGWRRL